MRGRKKRGRSRDGKGKREAAVWLIVDKQCTTRTHPESGSVLAQVPALPLPRCPPISFLRPPITPSLAPTTLSLFRPPGISSNDADSGPAHARSPRAPVPKDVTSHSEHESKRRRYAPSSRPQAKARSSVHRKLLRSPGIRPRRQAQGGHRHRGHSTPSHRIACDDRAHQRLLCLLSTPTVLCSGQDKSQSSEGGRGTFHHHLLRRPSGASTQEEET